MFIEHLWWLLLADGIYSRRKLGDNVLFDRLNNYHSNIKPTIEENPSMFLDTKLTNINAAYEFNIIGKPQNYFPHSPPKLQNTINEVQWL